MNRHRQGDWDRWEEPRPPSYQPPIVVQERRNIWDALRTFFRGCFLLVLIFFFTPLAIIFLPKLYEYLSQQFETLGSDFSKDTGLSSVWIGRWILAIILGLIMGVIIRYLRKL